MILGWKLKFITYKTLNGHYLLPHPHVAPYPFSFSVFYLHQGSFQFQNVPHVFLPQQLCTFCSPFLEHPHIPPVHSPFRSQHKCVIAIVQVSCLVVQYMCILTQVPSPLLHLSELCFFIYFCNYLFNVFLTHWTSSSVKAGAMSVLVHHFYQSVKVTLASTFTLTQKSPEISIIS